MRSLRLGESSWLSINNGRRQTSPGGWEREAREGGEEGKEIDGEREREAASNLGYFTTVASSWCVGCLEGNEKVVGRSGNTCPECVPDTVAARGEDERKIGTA